MSGVFIDGGRDVDVSNNIFVDTLPHYNSAEGLTWNIQTWSRNDSTCDFLFILLFFQNRLRVVCSDLPVLRVKTAFGLSVGPFYRFYRSFLVN